MSVEVYFHCVWNLQDHCFTFTVNQTYYRLTPTQMKTLLDKADAQATTPVGDLELDFGEDRVYKFTGIQRKAICEYLHKVYDGWHKFTFATDGQNKGKVIPTS